MGAMLDALHRLQTIETQIRSIREQLDSKERMYQAHQRRVATHAHKTTDLHAEIKDAQRRVDQLELERKSHEANIEKLREVLNKAKTNKEYAAILTELNTRKADILKMEDAVLAAMGRGDELKKNESEIRALLSKEQTRDVELRRAADELHEQFAEQLADLEEQRKEAASHIAPSILKLFERACERHEGEAMAMIQQAHPKRAEYTCGGCNMSVTLESINALQSRDDVQQCPNCLRILYLEVSAGVSVR